MYKDADYDSRVSVSIPITMSEMLLRGTLLKNSNYVYGLVVYTGKETRIQMNAARVPLKVGSFDRFLNIQIGILISVQVRIRLLCLDNKVALGDPVYSFGDWELQLARG